MAQVSKSRATLRISGDDLDPDEVTELLGCKPSSSQTKGQKLVGKNTGKVRIARFGMWRLEAEQREPEDLDGQISEILNQLNDRLTVWEGISERFDANLFVGFFMEDENEGCSISSESVLKLGERGIELQLDIYDGRE